MNIELSDFLEFHIRPWHHEQNHALAWSQACLLDIPLVMSNTERSHKHTCVDTSVLFTLYPHIACEEQCVGHSSSLNVCIPAAQFVFRKVDSVKRTVPTLAASLSHLGKKFWGPGVIQGISSRQACSLGPTHSSFHEDQGPGLSKHGAQYRNPTCPVLRAGIETLVFFQFLLLTFSSSHFTYLWVISIPIASEVTFYQLVTFISTFQAQISFLSFGLYLSTHWT